jgi:hypothetical protein
MAPSSTASVAGPMWQALEQLPTCRVTTQLQGLGAAGRLGAACVRDHALAACKRHRKPLPAPRAGQQTLQQYTHDTLMPHACTPRHGRVTPAGRKGQGQ